MKALFSLQPVLACATFAAILFTVGCGSSTFNDPPGIASVTVAQTANPLVAQVTMTTVLGCDGQVAVEFGPDTNYGRMTAWYPAAATSQNFTILVAGMRASSTYHLHPLAQRQCSSSTATENFAYKDMTFTTGALPSLPFPSLTVSRPAPSPASPENPGIELVNVVVAPGVPAMFTDRDANPIWYYDVGQGNWTFVYKPIPNGHVVVNITRNNATAILREVDLAGNTIQEMDTNALDAKMQSAGIDFVPTYYHHDVLPLTNGHLIILTNFTKNVDIDGVSTPVLGDGIVDLDPNWNPVWAWNSFDHLDVNRHLFGLPDWTHSNALLYSPDDGNLIVSMRHQSWILKLDYNNGAGGGDILWKLGYQGDFTLAQGTDPSLWFSFQHFPSMVSQDGSQTTLAIWDNGDYRPIDSNGDICGTNVTCYSRATLFQINESTMVADLLWDNPPGYYSLWGGSINEFTNGNVEYDINDPIPPPATGVGSQVQEVTQTSSPQVVWQMNVNGVNAYRAYRVPSLYPGVSWQY